MRTEIRPLRFLHRNKARLVLDIFLDYECEDGQYTSFSSFFLNNKYLEAHVFSAKCHLGTTGIVTGQSQVGTSK
jgi:hypothetical protein